MATTNYIQNFQSNAITEHTKGLTKKEKLKIWIHQHPKIMKTAQVALIILGLAVIATAPISWSAIGAGAVMIAIAGGLIAAINALALKFLDIAIPPHHSMKTHVFKPAAYGVGRLYYQGDVPVLELQSDDPYKAGQAHGYLMAPYLSKLQKRLQFIYNIARLPQARDLPNVLRKLREKIPQNYLRELEGIVNGYNQWGQSKFIKEKKISVDDLLLFHLMPDQLHFSPRAREKQVSIKQPTVSPAIPALACTVVIDQDAVEGLTFGRNMDWPSFGIFGNYSLIINRKYSDERLSTAEIGLPGFAGTLTGMNKEGLSLSMNVCSGNTQEINGMPAAFYNRMCLESCKTVEEVEQKINEQNPLGSYHLSTADANRAQAIHFFQGENNQHVIRKWKQNRPLVVTNCNYPARNEMQGNMHCSTERLQMINQLFAGAQEQINSEQIKRDQLVEAALTLPYVNNSLTTHHVVMNPLHKRIKVAFDNAFAGGSLLHTLNTELLFT